MPPPSRPTSGRPASSGDSRQVVLVKLLRKVWLVPETYEDERGFEQHLREAHGLRITGKTTDGFEVTPLACDAGPALN